MALQAKLIAILPKKGLFNEKRLFVGLNGAIRDTVVEGVRFMSTYPAKRGRSSYRRTGTLRRSWFFKIASGNRRNEGLIASSSSIAPYNEDVQGENQQELFDTLGWRNVKDLAKKVDNEFTRRVDKILGKAAR